MMVGEYLQLKDFFFFFQAEDGIRYLTVTGVQTCALPIWFAVLGVVALLVGVGYSFVLWRHFPLRLLLLCSLLFVGTLLFEDAATPTFVDTVSLLYGLACSMLSVRWFFIIRRRFE